MITDIEKTLNAWEMNYETVMAVQGESESRKLILTLIDRTGQKDGSFNAESINRPIDLTNLTARLFCKKPDSTRTLSDGEIVSAKDGKVSFVLPYQATAAAGDVSCQIMLTSADNEVQKTIGLHLEVQESDIDSIESSDEFDSLVKALNSVEKVSADAKTAVSTCNTATQAADTATSAANTATTNANTAADNANGKAALADTAAQNADDKASSAQTAADNANAAAKSANGAATAANTSKADCDTATAAANTAAQSANDKASAANSATEAANTAADNANGKASEADMAATSANAAAKAANDAKSACDMATQAANTATTNANTAAGSANSAADKANTAAENVDKAIAGDIGPAVDEEITKKVNIAGGIAGLDAKGKVSYAQLPAMDYVPTSEKGSANGVATLDKDGHIPLIQLATPNYSGKLTVHVTTSDSGALGNTKVQVTNTQLGAYYTQSLDALGSTTFQLLDNHVYAVTLIDYPTQYYGGADSVQITGGQTTTLNLEMTTEPDIIGWDYDTVAKTMVYTDGAANWTAATFDAKHHIQYNSFSDSWLLRSIHSCLYKDGVVQYYIDENDNTKKADGTAADITTGADGDVMVEFRKIYTKVSTYTDTNNHLHNKLQMTKQALSGYYPMGFYNKNNVVQDTTYVAKYLAYKDTNSKLRSLSGSTATTDYFNNLFDYARNVGSSYCIFHDEHLELICCLFSMLFKTLKFEDIYPECSYNYRLSNGFGNSSGLFNNNDQTNPKIFGIENLGCSGEVIEGKIEAVQVERKKDIIAYRTLLYGSIRPYSSSSNYTYCPIGISQLVGDNLVCGFLMQNVYPFMARINTPGEKNVYLSNSFVYLPNSGHYSITSHICRIGYNKPGIFHEYYNDEFYQYQNENDVQQYFNSLSAFSRLASIPV